jgi:hypothetical protein
MHRRFSSRQNPINERHLLILGVLGLLVASFDLTFAQSSMELEQKLAGSSSRTWVLQRFTLEFGREGACTSGEAYTFSANHRLTVSTCTNGRVVATEHQWGFTSDNSRSAITISDVGTYVVLFRDLPDGGLALRLQRVSDSTGAEASIQLRLPTILNQISSKTLTASAALQ